jgi:hypothetical protein
MAANNFRFISPGIFTKEIDESQIPAAPDVIGPVIVGRFDKGPAMRPVKVDSYTEFVKTFGEPTAGGKGDWRSGKPSGPLYAAYAAKAWLAAGTAPATVVRLLGEDHTDRASDGNLAGWSMNADPDGADVTSNGGSFGLWVIDSGNFGDHLTGTLGAIWYMSGGSSIILTGSARSDVLHPNVSGSNRLISTTAANNNFKAIICEGLTNNEIIEFNFDRTSPQYIRSVFNTNPTLTNGVITDGAKVSNSKNLYFLGETFERAVSDATTATGAQFGFIAPLQSGSAVWSDRRSSWKNAETGFFFSQHFGASANFDPPNTCTPLFKFKALDQGAWPNSNIKIAIEDIRSSKTPTSPYGTFTVAIYPSNAVDKKSRQQALERYTLCDLNPNSSNFVSRKIGDQYLSWSDSEKRHTINGTYPNNSRYVYIITNPDLDRGGVNPAALPFGGTGPIVPKSFTYISGASHFQEFKGGSGSATNYDTGSFFTYVTGGEAASPWMSRGDQLIKGDTTGAIVTSTGEQMLIASTGSLLFTGSWHWPSIALRSSSADAGNPGKKAFFGIQPTRAQNSTIYDEDYGDYNRGLPFDSDVGGRFDTIGTNGQQAPTNAQYSFIFSLDDLKISGADGVYFSGSRAAGTSISAVSSSFAKVLDSHDRFWMPMFGGTDGFDITEKEPLRNSLWASTTTNLQDHALNTVIRGIHTIADAEVVECNLLAVPGVTNTKVTDLMLETCSDRADALAIVDLEGIFTPDTENTSSYADNLGSVDTAVSNIQARDLNNSYGCAYYPWIQIRDTKSDRLLWAPPSIAALGTFGSSEAKSELWFAPAGFNRGGLSAGSAGIPVVQVSERLTSAQRDKLYENNINPIAKFPAEGIVIFGQKTLQQTQSALDRINVRRLMVFIKKEISRIAATLLFDQNTAVTWSRFTGQVEPFLSSVKTRFGVSDFKVVLDETTTTPDLIDRNVMYAKIFIKPTRAIEFIAIDFVIARTGASFDD